MSAPVVTRPAVPATNKKVVAVACAAVTAVVVLTPAYVQRAAAPYVAAMGAAAIMTVVTTAPGREKVTSTKSSEYTKAGQNCDLISLLVKSRWNRRLPKLPMLSKFGGCHLLSSPGPLNPLSSLPAIRACLGRHSAAQEEIQGPSVLHQGTARRGLALAPLD